MAVDLEGPNLELFHDQEEAVTVAASVTDPQTSTDMVQAVLGRWGSCYFATLSVLHDRSRTSFIGRDEDDYVPDVGGMAVRPTDAEPVVAHRGTRTAAR